MFLPQDSCRALGHTSAEAAWNLLKRGKQQQQADTLQSLIPSLSLWSVLTSPWWRIWSPCQGHSHHNLSMQVRPTHVGTVSNKFCLNCLEQQLSNTSQGQANLELCCFPALTKGQGQAGTEKHHPSQASLVWHMHTSAAAGRKLFSSTNKVFIISFFFYYLWKEKKEEWSVCLVLTFIYFRESDRAKDSVT